MKNLIIIGARGYGREVHWLVFACQGYGTEFTVKGFLDDKKDALDGLRGQYPPIISSVEEYVPEKDDVFICALGDSRWRHVYAAKILEKGGEFINLIGKGAFIHPSAKLGIGNIISGRCSISTEVDLGNFNILHDSVVIGHDAKIADYCFMGTRAFLGGGVKIEDFVALNPGCCINPHVVVERESIVGPNSTVIRKVKAGTTVIGVPAIRVRF